MTVPMDEVKTSPDFTQAGPSASISAACRARCALSTRTETSGSGIVRRDLEDFGGPKTSPAPGNRCTVCRPPPLSSGYPPND